MDKSGQGEYLTINSRPLFTIIFKLKNDNFMTRDFSPLIEWVLSSVSEVGIGWQKWPITY